MDHFAMLKPHEQLAEIALHLGKWKFIKNLWNTLWTIRNSRWTTWTTLWITALKRTWQRWAWQHMWVQFYQDRRKYLARMSCTETSLQHLWCQQRCSAWTLTFHENSHCIVYAREERMNAEYQHHVPRSENNKTCFQT